MTVCYKAIFASNDNQILPEVDAECGERDAYKDHGSPSAFFGTLSDEQHGRGQCQAKRCVER